MATSNLNELHIALDALRRHRRIFALTIFAGLVLTLLPVMLLPSKYESTAVILIESQEIPSELVRTTVTGFVEERLKSITQIALSRANLMAIIEQLNLYEKERQTQPAETVIEEMRKSITMTPIQADVQNVYGRPSTATIAFSLNYQSRSPQKALQTTSTLVTLFLEENYKSREAKVGTAYSFLEKQMAELEQKISENEAEIAKFKEAHLTALPEMVQINLGTLERVQKEMDVKRELLRSLTDRKIYLEGQIATISPMRPYVGPDGKAVLSPEEELRMLRNRYISMSSTLSPQHPDVIKIRQQIAALEKTTGTGPSSQIDDLEKAVEAQRSVIAELKGKYTDAHPEVQVAQKKLVTLEKELKAARASRQRRVSLENPDNPAWVSLDAQIKSTELELIAERRNLEDLQSKYTDYLTRIEESPRVEQDYRKLLREQTILQTQYQETKQKLQAAQEAKVLEAERAGERLTLIDPPILPETPVSPNRLLILAAGFVLSLGLGGGAVAFKEMTDSTVHGIYGARNLTSLPALVTIPYFATQQEVRRHIFQRKLIVAGALAVVLGMLLLCHFAVMPLDILFYTVLNRIKLHL